MEVLAVTNVDYKSQKDWEFEPYPTSEEGDCEAAVSALSKLLETELRAAKRTHLSCGEVLLPYGLLQAIARDILALADSEPCGLRGCVLYLNFAGEQDCRRLSTINCDPSTASTFELYLTLKQTLSGWNSFLPQFLKKITRGGTIMISTEYDLSKKKVYSSYYIE